MGRYDLKELWIEYEKIAMHFNDLLMRLRTQSLGGLGAIAATASILVTSHASPAHQSLYMFILFGTLTLAWISVGVIDLTYYDRMLLGTVGAIHELERLSATSAAVDHIKLSLAITDAVTHKKFAIATSPWNTGRRLYYILIGSGLLVLTASFGVASLR